MKSLYNLFLILYLLLPLSLFAQEDSETVIEEPPTLSLGLDNIVFNKGTIDVEVLSEIIASKKEELKKEVIRRVILSNMEGASFTFYNYAENILELILNPNNLKVATRSLLEYTANFALVYGFTELYLQLGIKTKDVELARVIEAYNEIQTLENQDLVEYAKNIKGKSNEELDKLPVFQSDKIFLLSYLKDISNDNAIEKQIKNLKKEKKRRNTTQVKKARIDGEITYLNTLKNKNNDGDCKLCNLSNILLDLTFDIAKNSPEIQKKGFFIQELNISNEEYTYSSCYEIDFLKTLQKGKTNCDTLKTKISSIITLYQENQSKNTIKYNLEILYDSIRNEPEIKNSCKCKKLKFWIAIELLRIEMANTTTAFFEYYEVLKETDFLKGNTFDEILRVLNSYLAGKSRPSEENLSQAIEILNLKIKEQQVPSSYPVNNGDLNTISQINKLLLNTNTRKISEIKILSDMPKKGKELSEKLMILSDNLHSSMLKYGSEEWEWTLVKLKEIIKRAKLYIINIEELESQKSKLLNDSLSSEQILRDSTNRIYILQHHIKIIKNTLLDSIVDNQRLSSIYQQPIQNVYQVINDLENPNKKYNNLRFANYILDSLNTQLAIINTQEDIDLKEVIKSLEMIAYTIKIDVLEAFKPKFEYIKDIAYVNPKQFIEFITKLNELDKSETYDYLFKILIDAGNVLAEEGNSHIFNSIINNVKKYTSINADSNAIDVDIETISADLFNRYGDRGGNINFYFSIGLNQGFPLSKSIPAGEENISSIGFASEKIGVKWKYWNFEKKLAKRFDENYQYTRAKYRPKQPIITDMYLLTYGSGILYNLTNTTTAGEDFNFPLWGIGTGISFFNTLDFNISYTVPFLPNERFAKNFDYGFVNVGFDIKITEYLEALGKKRRERKAAED